MAPQAPMSSENPGDNASNGPIDATLAEQVNAWIADDPDPDAREELARLVEAGEGEELARRFVGPLTFGTAGLRGEMGAGPHRMNRAVVIKAAAGLVHYLQEGGNPAPTIVIGYDARYHSHAFALDTAAVVVGAGGRALVLPEPLPTPVLAFAIRHLGTDAGVMVTASHNPPADNGYKVYLGDGCQIVPPADRDIAEKIAAVDSVASVPRADSGWEQLGPELLEAYVACVADVVTPGSPREVSILHTAMHGVGSDVVAAALLHAGFPAPQPVPEQADPDPDFSTVAFPNPEEPGAMDAALALAERVEPDVVLANDPDADRCAVAVPTPSGWRMLRGDEVGVLLGAHIAAQSASSPRRVLARSIVSSRMLGAIAAAYDMESSETLTGFKWIGRVPGLRFGYEEALGYCVDPEHVPDKDGVSAALVIAEVVATLKAQGRTVQDELDTLAERFGVHETDAFSVRVSDLSLIADIMARLRQETPTTIADVSVTSVDDLAAGSADLPPTDGMRLWLADETRVIARPSGTEPKLKVYLEAIVAVSESMPLAAAREEARRRLKRVRAAMEAITSVED